MNQLSKEIEFCTISLRDDGIIEQRFLWDTPYEIKARNIIQIGKTMTVLSNNGKKAVLSIAGLYGSMTEGARKVDISAADRYTFALGLVIKELPQRLLANFYFKIKARNYPVKIFKTESEATNWLQHQIRLNKNVG